ncbi:MFS transporter [Epibacterium sp. SM1969]|uniref:MFS transporter n=1 Tax=Tritonibacter aquimaris TaxID=2663379 RepID=A0A844AQ35_9RHOB|nr:MFS transporter [Tritonibacter aquimaris]MQY41617.1 MFS transporter [Tritonibacter aquimaris]
MLQVLSSAWALLLGVGLLMLGNGLQSSLLGVRGSLAGFSNIELSLVMAAYFAGFLGGSRLAPVMIGRVGHVRVFAALGSLISAVIIVYPALDNPIVWGIGRVMIGFCFSGVYVTAESWLNDAADNENRGKALSLYMMVMTLGFVGAQGLLLVGSPSDYLPFVIASIAVSISFAPILLSISPTPMFETAKPMSLKELKEASPLGAVGMFLLGGAFSAQVGMSAVLATNVGLSIAQTSAFVSSFYVGALVLQFPIGWMSDRMDRRLVIMIAAGIGACAGFVCMMQPENYLMLLGAGFVIGGMTTPLYSLLIAHSNDFLSHEEMPAASGGLVFINGLGAVAGPLVTGWLMSDQQFGPAGYFLFMATLLSAIGLYAAYRTTQRPTVDLEATGPMAVMAPTATAVAAEWAQEYVIETELEEQENDQ